METKTDRSGTNTSARTATLREPREASILELDYVERTEHSVVIFSKNWNDLTALLHNPTSFLRNIESLWPQDYNSYLAWTSGTPITVCLEPGYERDEHTRRVASIVGMDVGDVGFMQLRDLLQSPASENNVAQGAILVEFTIDTRTIFVRYFVPTVKPASLTFTNGVTNPKDAILPPTLSRVSTAGNPDIGSLHFDIGNNARKRADYVVDYIVNGDIICNNILSNHPDLKLSRSIFKVEGDDITVVPNAVSSPIQFFPDKKSAPMVIMEICPTPRPGFCYEICIVKNAVFHSDREVALGSTLVKCYEKKCP